MAPALHWSELPLLLLLLLLLCFAFFAEAFLGTLKSYLNTLSALIMAIVMCPTTPSCLLIRPCTNSRNPNSFGAPPIPPTPMTLSPMPLSLGAPPNPPYPHDTMRWESENPGPVLV